jgi:hypothetical protein
MTSVKVLTDEEMERIVKIIIKMKDDKFYVLSEYDLKCLSSITLEDYTFNTNPLTEKNSIIVDTCR